MTLSKSELMLKVSELSSLIMQLAPDMDNQTIQYLDTRIDSRMRTLQKEYPNSAVSELFFQLEVPLEQIADEVLRREKIFRADGPYSLNEYLIKQYKKLHADPGSTIAQRAYCIRQLRRLAPDQAAEFE